MKDFTSSSRNDDDAASILNPGLKLSDIHIALLGKQPFAEGPWMGGCGGLERCKEGRF